MPLYLVERYLPGVTIRRLHSLQRAARESCEHVPKGEQQVRYISSLFLPVDSRCLCLFEAPDAQSAANVNERAELPYSRIVNVLDLSLEGDSK